MSSSVFEQPWIGGLFGDEEVSSLLGPKAQLQHMLNVEAAYSRALGSAGIVKLDIAETAAVGILACEISISDLKAGTAKDGVPVPSLVRQLKQQMDVTLHAAIHNGMTSQDVLDTGLVCQLAAVIDVLERRLEMVDRALSGLVQSARGRVMTARTRMQSAKPIRVEHRVETWRAPLISHRAVLGQIKPRLLRLQLGGAVGDRTDLAERADVVGYEMATLLGLENPDGSWHSQRGTIVEFASWLSMVTGSLGKMGQDIALMSQQGIDEVELSGGGQSSAMAHKNNPVLPELLVTLAKFNSTQISGMHMAMLHEQERSGSAWMLEWMILPQMLSATARSFVVANEVCARIKRLGIAEDSVE